jgi:hypothetical protein
MTYVLAEWTCRLSFYFFDRELISGFTRFRKDSSPWEGLIHSVRAGWLEFFISQRDTDVRPYATRPRRILAKSSISHAAATYQ